MASLQGMIVYVPRRVDGDVSVQSAVISKLQALGANCAKRLSKEVTHVVFLRKLLPSPAEQAAQTAALRELHDRLAKVQSSAHIVSNLWVHATAELGLKALEHDYLIPRPEDPPELQFLRFKQTPEGLASRGRKRSGSSTPKAAAAVPLPGDAFQFDVDASLFSSSQQLFDHAPGIGAQPRNMEPGALLHGRKRRRSEPLVFQPQQPLRRLQRASTPGGATAAGSMEEPFSLQLNQQQQGGDVLQQAGGMEAAPAPVSMPIGRGAAGVTLSHAPVGVRGPSMVCVDLTGSVPFPTAQPGTMVPAGGAAVAAAGQPARHAARQEPCVRAKRTVVWADNLTPQASPATGLLLLAPGDPQHQQQNTHHSSVTPTRSQPMCWAAPHLTPAMTSPGAASLPQQDEQRHAVQQPDAKPVSPMLLLGAEGHPVSVQPVSGMTTQPSLGWGRHTPAGSPILFPAISLHPPEQRSGMPRHGHPAAAQHVAQAILSPLQVSAACTPTLSVPRNPGQGCSHMDDAAAPSTAGNSLPASTSQPCQHGTDAATDTAGVGAGAPGSLANSSQMSGQPQQQGSGVIGRASLSTPGRQLRSGSGTPQPGPGQTQPVQQVAAAARLLLARRKQPLLGSQASCSTPHAAGAAQPGAAPSAAAGCPDSHGKQEPGHQPAIPQLRLQAVASAASTPCAAGPGAQGSSLHAVLAPPATLTDGTAAAGPVGAGVCSPGPIIPSSVIPSSVITVWDAEARGYCHKRLSSWGGAVGERQSRRRHGHAPLSPVHLQLLGSQHADEATSLSAVGDQSAAAGVRAQVGQATQQGVAHAVSAAQAAAAVQEAGPAPGAGAGWACQAPLPATGGAGSGVILHADGSMSGGPEASMGSDWEDDLAGGQAAGRCSAAGKGRREVPGVQQAGKLPPGSQPTKLPASAGGRAEAQAGGLVTSWRR